MKNNPHTKSRRPCVVAPNCILDLLQGCEQHRHGLSVLSFVIAHDRIIDIQRYVALTSELWTNFGFLRFLLGRIKE